MSDLGGNGLVRFVSSLRKTQVATPAIIQVCTKPRPRQLGRAYKLSMRVYCYIVYHAMQFLLLFEPDQATERDGVANDLESGDGGSEKTPGTRNEQDLCEGRRG